LRITFLLTQSLESPSGLGRYWPLSNELVRLGHKVVILALHHDFQALDRRRFTRDDVEVCYVGQMHVYKRGSDKFYYSPARLLWVVARATWQLAKAALQVPTDVYHLGKPHPMNGLAVLLPHLAKRKPVYLDCDDYESASNRFSKGWQKQTVAFFEDHLPSIAAGITVNTNFTFERLRELNYPDERIFYVPNGVERNRFAGVQSAAVEKLRRQLGLVGRKVVLYVGSLSLASHAVDLLLEAFVTVHSAEPHAVFLLVGGGEDLKVLQRQAEALGLGDEVRFVGRVSPDTVPLYYLLAEASVDPVYDDPTARARSPLKVVESIASGTPVVTGDVGDRAALLARGGGLLVSPGDPLALAEGMLSILRDRSLYVRLSEEALSVREQYYWDRLVQDFVQVYQNTV
jgi:glycosyltransferase involved in cell wall biosynthesis